MGHLDCHLLKHSEYLASKTASIWGCLFLHEYSNIGSYDSNAKRRDAKKKKEKKKKRSTTKTTTTTMMAAPGQGGSANWLSAAGGVAGAVFTAGGFALTAGSLWRARQRRLAAATAAADPETPPAAAVPASAVLSSAEEWASLPKGDAQTGVGPSGEGPWHRIVSGRADEWRGGGGERERQRDQNRIKNQSSTILEAIFPIAPWAFDCKKCAVFWLSRPC